MANILYIEDNADIADTTKTFLEMVGHQVNHVANISDARAALQSGKYDVILSDFDLEDTINGEQFAKELQESGSRIPFILHSSHSWDELNRLFDVKQTTPELGKPISAFLQKQPGWKQKALEVIDQLTGKSKGEARAL